MSELNMDNFPPVPPGVRTFDPRRLRRHARKTREMYALALKRREVAFSEMAQHKAAKAEVRARVERERRENSLLGRVKAKAKGFAQRLFGRKTG